jgi:hypothetical protein
MPSGANWRRLSRQPSLGGAHAPALFVRWSRRSSTCCGAGVRGACCPMIFRAGTRCRIISVSGAKPACGSRGLPPCARRCGGGPPTRPIPGRPFLTARRCKRPSAADRTAMMVGKSSTGLSGISWSIPWAECSKRKCTPPTLPSGMEPGGCCPRARNFFRGCAKSGWIWPTVARGSRRSRPSWAGPSQW